MLNTTTLAQKVAIVTGSGRGLGAHIALALASAGASVCVNDLNPDRVDAVTSAIESAGGAAFGWQGDVANRFQAAAMIERTREHFGGLDILVHNAHAHPSSPALKMDEWDLRRTVEVNIIGAFFCAQLAGRVFSDQGHGQIALLVRAGADQPGQSAFAATQAALTTLAGSLAAELIGDGVQVFVLPVTTHQDTATRLLNQLTR